MNNVVKLANRPIILQKQLLCNVIGCSKYSTVAADDTISSEKNEDTAGFGFTAKELSNAKPFSDIPSPPSYPLIGNLLSFKPFGKLDAYERVSCCTALHEKYGDLVRIRIPFIPLMDKCVEVLDPNDYEIIFRNEGKNPGRAVSSSFLKYREEKTHGLGLFLSNGEEWWKYRKPLNPAMMKANAAKPYMNVQDPIGDELVMNLKKVLAQNKDNTHPMIMSDVSRYSLESVCAVVFDRRLGCMAPDLPPDSWQQKFIDSVQTGIQNSVSLDINPRHKLLNAIGYKSRKQRSFEDAMDYITETSRELVQKSKEDWSGIPEEELQKKFLPQLLNIPNLELKNKLTLIFDMLLAAIDTTTYTTIHIAYLLAKNPDIQEKLFEEINQHIKKGEPIQTTSLEKCRYLRACIKETHRMLPIATILTRLLPRDVVIKGYRIPAGTTVFIEQKYVANTSRYVENPEQFNPNRWLRVKGKNSEKLNPFLSLPFGFGPRMCVGKRFAEQELNIAIVKLIQNFRFEYDGDKVPLRGMGIDKVPVKLDFKFYER